MSTYEKRLLREVMTGYRHLTADDYASIWKRQKYDVRMAAKNLLATCQIKMTPTGELYAI